MNPPEPHARKFAPVHELVPHGAPMLALDELVDWQPGRARATAVLGPDHYFVHRGTADACVALELIAQAIAACLGQEALRAGDPVRPGMIVACRELRIARSEIQAGEMLTLDVHRVRGSDSASHFEGEARDASGALIAAGTFTLVHGSDPTPRSGT